MLRPWRTWLAKFSSRRNAPPPGVYRSQYAAMTGAYSSAWVTNAGPARRSTET